MFKEIIDQSIFNWEDLNGKTLKIQVAKDISKDGESIMVSGYSKKDNKYYILHCSHKEYHLV